MKAKFVKGRLSLEKPKVSAEEFKRRKEEIALIPKEFDFDKNYETLLIYTDGACWPNPGPGSCAYVIVDPILNKPLYAFSKFEKSTSNNKMELSALIYALDFLAKTKVKKIIFCSDSQYVINSISKGWAVNWIKREENERPNLDLWKTFFEKEMKVKSELLYKWIKGHAGNKYNEMADLLTEMPLEQFRNADEKIEKAVLTTFYHKPCLLALDASSTVIGYSIFDIEKKTLLKMDHLIHDQETSLIERVLVYEKLLIKLREEYNITDVVIEKAFQGFFGGGSSAATIEILTSINFGYQLVTHKLGVKVNLITVAEARKLTFPNVKIRTLAKLKKMREKEYCFELLKDNETVKPYLTTRIMKSGPRKGEAVHNEWCKDMVDSYITGNGYLKTL